ncbi:AAA family ATPase [Halobacillus naozhouensis]|uniref:ATP-binding protein n=1 Tax=Halobacillus naozhouensis TaxID=554880 RepID=A0ABY8J5N3_9BACI|nr:ATP-binding protein [Halobacillus naozhouensis]WFT76206.1 ATP-binding protein [Halobacillus naozhouensis]
MSYFVESLLLDSPEFENYMFGEDFLFSNLSKVNILVGSNNSGKSNFMRRIVSIEDIMFKPNNINLEKLSNLKREVKEELESIMTTKGILDYGEVLSKSKQSLVENEFLTTKEDFIRPFEDFLNEINNIQGSLSVTSKGGFTSLNTDIINEEIKQLGDKYIELLEDFSSEIPQNTPNKFQFSRVYIPTLRGLRGFSKEDFESKESDIYHERTINDYFSKNNSNFEVFTGLNLYKEIKNLLLGNLRDRELIREFEKFLGEKFFSGENISLIPSIHSDVVNVKIGTENERPIYDLGDGIQSIIIMTFPLFKYKDENLLLFIEEPEMFLHPGMQRTLLETFMSNELAPHQYFLTTHSNHFLDLTLDIDQISIYTFNKELKDDGSNEKTPKFNVVNVNNEETSTLEMLGVKDSSVFLSNCTIWVEGITDRYYIRHFLKLYQMHLFQGDISKYYREDQHYSFIEYSGGNITHWSFLDEDDTPKEKAFKSISFKEITKKIFLITDQDGEGKNERQAKLNEALGDDYFCLSCREIENLITKDILLKVVADYEGKSPEGLDFKTDFSYADYKNAYLGSFIENNLEDKQRKGKYNSSSGTVSDKLNFCKKVVHHTNTFEDLSDESKELCQRIYSFIESNN